MTTLRLSSRRSNTGTPTLLLQLLMVASCLILTVCGGRGGGVAAGGGGHAAESPSHTPCDFRGFHPRRYAVYHLQSRRAHRSSASWSTNAPSTSAAAIAIDGVLNETAWEQTPWTQDFVDIQGTRHWSQPWFTTKVKMRYDDAFLYIGAYVEETSVWANVTQRNEVVFQDNDFEVFVDADGSTHNYKDVEVNALNTTWNLWLNRPYRDGGHENSTRVDPQHGFDMFNRGMKSAVYMKGTPNDAGQRLHFWTVEIALPLKELVLHTQAVLPPLPSTFWRINFSRVEWAVASDNPGKRYVKTPGEAEDNWVWSPQYAVNMHMPENWGYIQFRSHFEAEGLDAEVPLDPEWNVRYLSFQLYYAQHAFKEANGHYARNLSALEPYFQKENTSKCINLQHLSVNNTENTFEARLKSIVDPLHVASIRDDSFIYVHSDGADVMSVE